MIMNNKSNNSKDKSLSRLYKHIKDNVTTSGLEWRKLYHKIMFDKELNRNDKVVYLVILKICFKVNDKDDEGNDKFNPIMNKTISEMCGIQRTHISKHVDKLVKCGYVSLGNDSTMRLLEVLDDDGKEETFLSITKSTLETIKYYGNEDNAFRKLFIDTIVSLCLSNGNDKLPTMNVCKSKLGVIGRKYFKVLKDLRVNMSDVQLYESLDDLRYPTKVISSSSKGLSIKVIDKIDLPKTSKRDEVIEVLELMKDTYGREFNSKKDNSMTMNTLNKYTLDDVVRVVFFLGTKWDNDTMRDNLKPSTIFKDKFDVYLSEAKSSSIGRTKYDNHKLKLSHGEEIDKTIASKLEENAIYKVYVVEDGVVTSTRKIGRAIRVGINVGVKFYFRVDGEETPQHLKPNYNYMESFPIAPKPIELVNSNDTLTLPMQKIIEEVVVEEEVETKDEVIELSDYDKLNAMLDAI